MIGLLETRTRPLNCFCEFLNSLVLTNHALAKGIGHCKQSPTFILCHALHGDPCNHRNYRSDIVLSNEKLFGCGLGFPTSLGSFEFFQQSFFSIPQLGCFFKILTLHHLIFLQLNRLDLGLKIHNFSRHINVTDMHPSARFIQNIYRLVWQMSIAHISHTQIYTSFQSLRRIFNSMVIFVFIANIM